MKNIENLLQNLLSEHEFLKNMQSRIVENYDILTQNQKQNADNHEVVVNNQTVIVRNQRQIVQNQVTLDVIVKTQTLLLNLVNKMAGQAETLEQTENIIHALKAVSQENLRFNAFNDSENLS